MALRYAVASGNFNATSTWSTSATGAAGASVPVAGDIAYSNNQTVTITANATCIRISNAQENGSISGGSFVLNPGVTLTADVVSGGSATTALTVGVNSPDSVAIIGNVTAGGGGHVIAITGTGTVNITGNIAGSTTAIYGLNITGAATVNINGSTNFGYLGGTSIGMTSNLACNITITGDVYSANVATGLGIAYQGSSASTLTINGNVYGGGQYIAIGLGPNGPSLVVNGNVYGGSSSNGYGIATGVNSTVTVNGNAYAGTAQAAISNQNSGATVKVVRAVGNGYGVGSAVGSSVVAITTSNTAAATFVEELEFGPLGQSPISGPVSLTDKSSNKILFYRPGQSQKTLVDASASNVLPAASDVRFGTVYNSGSSTGTCNVPSAGQVAFGVAVDATTGTAVLAPSDVWNAATSTLTASGSIGERLKNVSTDAVTGQQIANALSA